MRKRRVTKQQVEASKRGKAKVAAREARDVAYRTALGVAKDGKLPNSIGNTASAGGGRDRRGKANGGIGDSPDQRRGAATRNRAKLIG
ncbi:hypothetical protein [Mycobacterium sp.]|uniref:hypothetical protein n=1 Tax=Mycobacterium sp. TaxID=1785 RepID=UPI002C9A5354|nr:hypothetical protein [Mycobacterium sp.]HKP39635.1 hypothetical protein [Mycobacterium sp.]